MLAHFAIKRAKPIFAAIAIAAAALPVAAGASPELYSQMLRGANTLAQFDEAIAAAERGQEKYAETIRFAERTLANDNAYLLHNAEGEMITATHGEIANLGAEIALELTLDPSDQRLRTLAAVANRGSEVDHSLRAAIMETIVALAQAEGRTPDPARLGNATRDSFFENIRGFDAQNRFDLEQDLRQLRADQAELDQVIARAKRDRVEFARNERGATQPRAATSAAAPPRSAHSYKGEVSPMGLMNRSSMRFQTPIHFSMSGQESGSLLFDFWVYSQYNEGNGLRQACMMGTGRSDGIAIASDGRFRTSLPLRVGYRSNPGGGEHPCNNLSNDRENGDPGDPFSSTVTGRVDADAGTVELTMEWIHGPIEVTLRAQ